VNREENAGPFPPLPKERGKKGDTFSSNGRMVGNRGPTRKRGASREGREGSVPFTRKDLPLEDIRLPKKAYSFLREGGLGKGGKGEGINGRSRRTRKNIPLFLGEDNSIELKGDLYYLEVMEGGENKLIHSLIQRKRFRKGIPCPY